MGTYKAVFVNGGTSTFKVIGSDGVIVPEIDGFLLHLTRSGGSPYTIRSYAQGLAHFFSWLAAYGVCLDHVDRNIVESYIDQFRLGAKEGACKLDLDHAGETNPLTRKQYPSPYRDTETINHRLSVLTSFFTYLVRKDEGGNLPPRKNPMPETASPMQGQHGMPGRDAPRRGPRADFRRRRQETLPKAIDAELAERLIETATSRRDKAILTLLWRSGQRIGDWSEFAGHHGILGMSLHDLNEFTGTIVVRLKGARAEHRVPVTEDFWPLFRDYLNHERGDPPTQAAWVGLRRGKGKSLTYSAFEASLRYVGHKIGANVNAHMFRHALAQAVLDVADVTVAQELLGHERVSTTAETYLKVDERAMAEAVAAAAYMHRPSTESMYEPGYVFGYDAATVDELEKLSDYNLPGARQEEHQHHG